jgi:hypothetical protein
MKLWAVQPKCMTDTDVYMEAVLDISYREGS